MAVSAWAAAAEARATAGTVTISNTGSITTLGDLSFAIFAESIGGGGGKGGGSLGDPAAFTDVTVNLGGNGGSNGSGGQVTLNSSGTIATGGREAIGMTAQSVGGGGGVSGFMRIYAANDGGQAVSYSGANFVFAPVSLGGAGGASGNGGSAIVNLTAGTVTTSGTDAYGVLAQSVGGGGGLIVGLTGRNDSGGPDSIFGGGKLSGNGGAVSVALSGGSSIQTTGAGAVGILAQSIGGGGGIVGGMSNVSLEQGSYSASSNLHSGQGGDIQVSVAQGTRIETSGVRAHGIFAQSAGGGGGIFSHQDGGGFTIVGSNNYSCGNSCTGAVDVNVAGSVVVNGSDAYGIYAQSRGNGTNGVHVTLQSGGGSVNANGTGGAAIYIDSPNGTNLIDNSGSIGGSSGIAIDGNGSGQINNLGTITGNIESSGGAYSITNHVGGRIYTAPSFSRAAR